MRSAPGARIFQSKKKFLQGQGQDPLQARQARDRLWRMFDGPRHSAEGEGKSPSQGAELTPTATAAPRSGKLPGNGNGAKPLPLLFEVSWEVCSQTGGIYTVLRSKC